MSHLHEDQDINAFINQFSNKKSVKKALTKGKKLVFGKGGLRDTAHSIANSGLDTDLKNMGKDLLNLGITKMQKKINNQFSDSKELEGEVVEENKLHYNWRDDFIPTRYETVDIIKPEPLKPTSSNVMYEHVDWKSEIISENRLALGILKTIGSGALKGARYIGSRSVKDAGKVAKFARNPKNWARANKDIDKVGKAVGELPARTYAGFRAVGDKLKQGRKLFGAATDKIQKGVETIKSVNRQGTIAVRRAQIKGDIGPGIGDFLSKKAGKISAAAKRWYNRNVRKPLWKSTVPRKMINVTPTKSTKQLTGTTIKGLIGSSRPMRGGPVTKGLTDSQIRHQGMTALHKLQKSNKLTNRMAAAVTKGKIKKIDQALKIPDPGSLSTSKGSNIVKSQSKSITTRGGKIVSNSGGKIVTNSGGKLQKGKQLSIPGITGKPVSRISTSGSDKNQMGKKIWDIARRGGKIGGGVGLALGLGSFSKGVYKGITGGGSGSDGGSGVVPPITNDGKKDVDPKANPIIKDTKKKDTNLGSRTKFVGKNSTWTDRYGNVIAPREKKKVDEGVAVLAKPLLGTGAKVLAKKVLPWAATAIGGAGVANQVLRSRRTDALPDGDIPADIKKQMEDDDSIENSANIPGVNIGRPDLEKHFGTKEKPKAMKDTYDKDALDNEQTDSILDPTGDQSKKPSLEQLKKHQAAKKKPKKVEESFNWRSDLNINETTWGTVDEGNRTKCHGVTIGGSGNKKDISKGSNEPCPVDYRYLVKNKKKTDSKVTV